ncbi:unnamed protein product [Citrullus colocynthis]|uniref:Uncharacterized protein n=1 Tax=Citrullus colocynthis TaxID=252529 RepID=A0ABP0XSR2_9ROSI
MNIEMKWKKKVGPEEFFLFSFFLLYRKKTYFFCDPFPTHAFFALLLTLSPLFLSQNPKNKRKLNKPISFFSVHLIPLKQRRTAPFFHFPCFWIFSHDNLQ